MNQKEYQEHPDPVGILVSGVLRHISDLEALAERDTPGPGEDYLGFLQRT